MIFGSKRRSPFGLMSPGEGFGGGMADDAASEAAPMGGPVPAHIKKSGDLLGSGALRGVAGTVGDWLLQRDEMAPIYLPQLLDRRRREDEEAQYQRHRTDENTDWQTREQWKLDHKPPRYNDTIEDVKWYMGASPEERTAYDAMHPIYRTGPDGLPYPMARPSTLGQPATPMPTFTQDDWDKAGGGVSDGTGTFPRR